MIAAWKTRGKVAGVGVRNLNELVAKMYSVAGVNHALAVLSAPVISEKARSDFNAQLTPNGDSWADWWRPHRRYTHLVASGELRDAVTTYEPRGSKIAMGGGRIPPYARFCMPELWWPQGVPKAWADIFESLLPQAVAQVMGGG